MKSIRKVIIGIFLTLTLLLLMPVRVNANDLKVETIKVTSAGIEVKVHSDNKVSKLKIFKKVDSEWVQFYINYESGYTDKIFFISKNKLSTEDTSDLRIDVIDENGEETSTEQTVEKLPEVYTPPVATPLPSVTTSTEPSTRPTTSTKPEISPSTIASPRTSTTVPTQPTSSPSTSPKTTVLPTLSPSVPSINEKKVTSISLNYKTLSIEEGKTIKLIPTINPKGAVTTLKWSSNNTKAVKVSASGTVTAVAAGTATVTVKTTNGKTASCKVTVKAKPTISAKLNGHSVQLANGDDRVYFLDVTDYRSDVEYNYDGSDAIIIESNGKYAMIDTGIDYQGSRVVSYLKDIGATNLEFILITHSHIDHYGGFEKIINNGIKVKKLYIKNISSGKSDRISAYKKIISNAKSKNIPVYNVSSSSNQKATCGDFTFTFYNTQDRLKNKASPDGENVNSVVALAKIHGKKMYFAADIVNVSEIGCYAENEATKLVGSVDVYKAAHHLYSPSNSTSILKKLNPNYAVVTNQPGRYGTVRNARLVKENTNVTDKTLYYTGSGTVITTISDSGNFTFQKLGAD